MEVIDKLHLKVALLLLLVLASCFIGTVAFSTLTTASSPESESMVVNSHSQLQPLGDPIDDPHPPNPI